MKQLPAGVYTAVGQGATGCDATSLPVNITSSPLATPEICMITVDSVTNQSIVVWEKAVTNAINGYGIYKESPFNSNNYQQIAVVPYDSLSEYTDVNSNAEVLAERYRISIIDTCGGETTLSDVARAIGLKVFPGIGVQRSLSWNVYVGSTQNVTQYTIYSGPNYNQLSLLASVTPSANNPNVGNYLDEVPVNGINTVYRVYAEMSQSCESTRGIRTQSVSNGSGNSAIPFVQMLSEHSEADAFDFTIMPNPNNGVFTVVLVNEHPAEVRIYDISGKLLVQEMAISGSNHFNLQMLSKGTYLIRVVDANGFSAHKLLVIN